MNFYDKLTEQLKRHEGVRLYPYEDTTGHITIGIGHNLSAQGISLCVSEILFMEDIRAVERQLDEKIPYWRSKPENVRLVLCDMCFNLGINGLLTFDKFLHAIKCNAWETAQMEMLDSLWAKQVGTRATNLKEML